MTVLLLGFGNPIADYVVQCDSKCFQDLLQRYNLNRNNVIKASNEHESLFDIVLSNNHKLSCIPGGACLNTIRVAQYCLSNSSQATVFTGCINDDAAGSLLRESCIRSGVVPLFQITDTSEPTGRCAVLVNGDNRSIVAQLGATTCYTQDFISSPTRWKFVEEAFCIYITGFFFVASLDTIKLFMNYSFSTTKQIAMNLSAIYLCQELGSEIFSFLPCVDLLFGNKDEVHQLLLTVPPSSHLTNQDASTMAQYIAALPKRKRDQPRLAIITQGADPVVVAYCHQNNVDSWIKEYNVTPVSKEELCDTTAAGDAFVGGFLSQFVLAQSIDDCVKKGIEMARFIIQRPGCSLPDFASL